MKKAYILFAAASLVLASCSNNDVRNEIVEDEIAIGFNTSAIDNATKANAGEMTAAVDGTGSMNKNGNTMEVWGWKTANSTNTQIFDNQLVVYDDQYNNHVMNNGTTTSTYWKYSPLKYWDRTASYKFYAVAPDGKFALVEDNTTEANRKFSATSIPAVQVLADMAGANKVKLATAEASVSGTASTAIDYLVAGVVDCAAGAVNQGNADDKDVAFTFNHILSKLTVKVKMNDDLANDPNEPKVELTDLSISFDGMATKYEQKTAGAVTASRTEGDAWTVEMGDAIAIVAFDVDGTNVTEALELAREDKDSKKTGTAAEIASYFVAPTLTGATPGDATIQVKVGYTIQYKDGASDTYSTTDTFETVYTTVEALKDKLVQNNHNILTVVIGPQAIYFDVEKVNTFTDVTPSGEVTIQ